MKKLVFLLTIALAIGLNSLSAKYFPSFAIGTECKKSALVDHPIGVKKGQIEPTDSNCGYTYTIILPKDAKVASQQALKDTVILKDSDCSLLGLNYQDEVFNDATDSMVIHRTYFIINWLAYQDVCNDRPIFTNVDRTLWGGGGTAVTYVMVVDNDKDKDEEFWISKDSTINNADDYYLPGDADWGGLSPAAGVTNQAKLSTCNAMGEYYHTFSYTQLIYVKASYPINPVCINGLSVALASNGQGNVAVSIAAQDLVAADAYSPDGQGPETQNGLKLIKVYSINRVGEAIDKNQGTLTFNCTDKGNTVNVELHAWDALGNYGTCVVPVQVQDNQGLCTGVTSVWPGDVDRNGEVNHKDLFPIGLAYGKAGQARKIQSTEWKAQVAQLWATNLPQRPVDLSNVDADGNGQINAGDTSALAANWRLKHTDGIPKVQEPEIREEGVNLFFQGDTLYTGPGQWLPVALGSKEQLAENIYGIAFTIAYDPAQIKKHELSFFTENSWLGTLGKDLLVFQHNDSELGKLDVALVRMDGRNRTGQGVIGKVKVTIEDLVFNLREGQDAKLKFQIEDVELISNAYTKIPVNPLRDAIVVKNDVVSKVQDRLIAHQVRLFPQPASDQLFVDFGSLQVKGLQLLQQDGRALTPILNPTRQLDLRGIPGGVIFLKVLTDKGVGIKKILITK